MLWAMFRHRVKASSPWNIDEVIFCRWEFDYFYKIILFVDHLLYVNG